MPGNRSEIMGNTAVCLKGLKFQRGKMLFFSLSQKEVKMPSLARFYPRGRWVVNWITVFGQLFFFKGVLCGPEGKWNLSKRSIQAWPNGFVFGHIFTGFC